ncbi:Eukaryotic translation initiation factor 4E [Homalodisca vitripennis]|nr:Eukaryotic translation initiation factor 4E [Homalodisca vitripennis]
MSESLKPSTDSAYRRAAKLKAARSAINNNYIEFKKPIRTPNNRRRNKGKRMKSVSFTLDVEMTGQSGQETEGSHSSSHSQVTMKKPERQYSREELIELMTHPLSSVKHPCLDSPQNKSLVSGKSSVRWLEDRWDHRKRTDSLTDEDRSDNSLDPQKKRMNDPKAERLRKEQDVVLSPQRRSFNSGCFVNLPPQHVNSTNRRPESPLKGERESNHRDLPSRRIGSGRIMRDPVWDFRNVEKEDVSNQNINNHDFNFRQRDDRFERRTFERSHDKERQPQRNSRYNNSNERRKYEKNEPEEPEWFSGK